MNQRLELSSMKLTADVIKAKILLDVNEDVKVDRDCKSSYGAFYINPNQQLESVSRRSASDAFLGYCNESCKVVSLKQEVIAVGQKSDELYRLKAFVHVKRKQNSFKLSHRRDD